MQIFVSYASEQKDQAESLAFSLRERGHDVFLDRDDLPAGRGFHEQIETAIQQSDLMVFLISPQSVTPGRFTLSEIEFARQRWRKADRRLLSVMIEPTVMEQIPAFAKSVTILEPKGNMVAEVAAAVDKLRGIEYSLTVALQLGAISLIAGLLSWFSFDPMKGEAYNVLNGVPMLGRVAAPEIGFLFGFPIAFGAWHWGLRRWWVFLIPFVMIAACYWVTAPTISKYTTQLSKTGPYDLNITHIKKQTSDPKILSLLVKMTNDIRVTNVKYDRSIAGLLVGFTLAFGTMFSLGLVLPAFRSMFRWLVVTAVGAAVSSIVTMVVLQGNAEFSRLKAVLLMTLWLVVFGALVGYWLARGRTNVSG